MNETGKADSFLPLLLILFFVILFFFLFPQGGLSGLLCL